MAVGLGSDLPFKTKPDSRRWSETGLKVSLLGTVCSNKRLPMVQNAVLVRTWMTMDFTTTLAALGKASAFDLYRLRAAIDRILDQPGWMAAVQSRLRIGQAIDYFDPPTNRSHQGQILELRRKQAVILDLATQKRWLVSYAAINLDSADVEIREQPKQGLGRNSVAIGDMVGFLDRQQQQRRGRIIRLNDKTVTLQCDEQQWRVSYALLHRMVDSYANNGEVPELTALDGQAEIIVEPDE